MSFLMLLKSFKMSNAPIWIEPLVGSTSPVKHLKVDDFPAPLTPSKAKHSPASNPNEIFSTATTDLVP